MSLLTEMFGDWLVKKKLTDDTQTKEIMGNQIATDFRDGAFNIEDVVNSYILNFDFNLNNGATIVDTYRDVAQYNDVGYAIDDIVNEAVSFAEDEAPVQLDLSKIEGMSEAIKKKIYDRWEHISKVMKLKDTIHDRLRNFYVDGRLAYQKVIDKDSPKNGIINIVELDVRNIQFVRSVKYDETDSTIASIEEFFVYNESNLANELKQNNSNIQFAKNAKYKTSLKINKEAISYATSGLVDRFTGNAISWLHKAVKPANQLNMMENALVIYRISRAPERRVFYVDVGNLPKSKAEQYLQNLKNAYRNKMSYDPDKGMFSDNRHLQTMQEDFWMPRTSGGKGTEVTTLEGGKNLDDIDDVKYFLNRLYKALNVPISRLEADAITSIAGRATEINRDELKFSKYVSKVRKRFNIMFRDVLRTDLILTNILTAQEYTEIEDQIYFTYAQDMYLEERKFFEMTRDRLELAGELKDYTGVYYSNDFIRKKILHQTDEEIIEEDKLIKEEATNPQYLKFQMDQMGGDVSQPALDPYDPNVIANLALANSGADQEQQ